jgi:uncharacterized membrane protein YbhN (UPF0104 family)
MRWLAATANAAHTVLIKSRASISIVGFAVMVHCLTITSVWCTAQAVGMPFPLIEAAVLFIVMLGVALIPISFGGWGVRELAVVFLLSANGISEQRALLFSASFGLTLLAGSLPGAFVWAFYSLSKRSSNGAAI